MERVPANAITRNVERILGNYPVVDIHTHLFPPAMGSLCLWTVDHLLDYHYLHAEALRTPGAPSADMFKTWPLEQRAEFIWQTLFINRSPMSEATRGVVTVLRLLGLNVKIPTLGSYREWFARLTPEQAVDKVLALANVKRVYMTNDPLDAAERRYWEQGFEPDPRFVPVLRVDSALLNWPNPCEALRALGYDARAGKDMMPELQRYVREWAERFGAKYIAASLPPRGSRSFSAPLFESAVLETARAMKLPVALMMGVRRGVNPSYGLAGDGSGPADLDWLMKVAAEYPDVRLLVTVLAREDQHPLCVLARKFPNLTIFGCWWFVNNPSLIEEITRMRLDMLGPSFIPQHSDCRILLQLLYKWEHSRRIVADVLSRRYLELAESGWPVTVEDIERDVGQFFDGSVLGS